MKPYYQDDAVTIYCADYRDIDYKNGTTIDLVLTDPPYNSSHIGKDKKDYKSWFQLSKEDYKAFCNEWFNRMIELTSHLAFTPGIAHIWNYPPADWVVCWHKPSSVSYNRYAGLNAWEPVLLYGPYKKKWHGQDYIKQDPLNFKRGVERKHPCPKPERVWDWLITQLTNPGDLILDPFLGSGTTAWCAKKLGRRCVGVDIEPEYCEIAANRCRQTVMELFRVAQ